MRDLVKEQKELYREVKEAGLEPVLTIKHHAEGTISIIPIGSDEFFVLFEEEQSAIRVKKN
jgi:sarcosine oxidase gamma subunit